MYENHIADITLAPEGEKKIRWAAGHMPVLAAIAEDFRETKPLAGLRVALSCRDRYGCLLAAGITSMIGLQAFINMGVVTGILPTTGLPLPFFSAGGTSISILMSAVAVLMNISASEAVD